MAQKDTKVNIELAKDTSFLARASKEDSVVMRTIAIETQKDGSSMKTIAVLPMFSWDDNDLPVANSRFKYYWTVVIPITFLVLFVWGVVTLLPWEKWLSERGRNPPSRNLALEQGASQATKRA